MFLERNSRVVYSVTTAVAAVRNQHISPVSRTTSVNRYYFPFGRQIVRRRRFHFSRATSQKVIRRLSVRQYTDVIYRGGRSSVHNAVKNYSC